MTLVFMFPGQNSRYPQMIDALRPWSGCEQILRDASDVLGRDLSEHYRSRNPEMFSHNRDIQIGVFLASYTLSRRLADEGLRSDASLGLSLGEYNHLVEIGALSFEDALRLLEARGDAYQAGPRGLMMSVFPCDVDQVKEAQKATVSAGQADVSIELAEKHFVLGGEPQAVQAAASWLEEEAYATARVIDSALPMHSRMFQPAADIFKAALEKVKWRAPRQAYISNVDGVCLPAAQATDFADRLYRHVFNTVRWAPSLLETIGRFPDATFVEVGPKCILHNAFRREHKRFRSFCTDDPDSDGPILPMTIQQLRETHDAA
jgi:[acyl-carrier-protein] S-malonyltransferase